jgi:hypothetical protein
MLRHILATAFFLSAATNLLAGDPPRKTKLDPRKVEVVFADGSTVKMTLMQDNVEITSRYGKFKVPVEDIVRIEFGFRYPEGVEEKVRNGIAGLGNAQFQKREAASAELLELAELAYPSLQEAVKSADSEISKRAEELVKKIEETIDQEQLSIPKHDVIITKDFAFPGRIDATHFKARTPYFGEVQVALAEIRGMRSIGAPSHAATFSLEAAKYAALDTTVWRDTGIDVTKETIIEVDASGTVQIYPGNGYSVNADGYKAAPPPMGQPFPGALIGRIGAKGKMFTLGSNFNGKAIGNGRLYVRIKESPWMNESTGSFDVTIKTTFGSNGTNAIPRSAKPSKESNLEIIVPPIEKKDK